ncbi:hypothetical protein DFJ73DRAFT_427830 [Zopfochytrium polystomum]|nr:hypothetical protein DFJ73DRAFT_427830 [Zopfochytrium polystomum]
MKKMPPNFNAQYYMRKMKSILTSMKTLGQLRTMSLFDQIAFLVLVAEISLYLASLVPLTFLPVRVRTASLNYGAKFFQLETVKWLTRLLLIIDSGVLADTTVRLTLLELSLHDAHGQHVGGVSEGGLEDIQFKNRLFYSQRNLFLSIMSLFMFIVVVRRMKDVYALLQSQEMCRMRRRSPKSHRWSSTIDHLKRKSASPTQKEPDGVGDSREPVENEGIRKRGI